MSELLIQEQRALARVERRALASKNRARDAAIIIVDEFIEGVVITEPSRRALVSALAETLYERIAAWECTAIESKYLPPVVKETR